MKITHRILLTVLFVLSLAACTSPSTAATPSPAPSVLETPSPSAVVTFADPTLEALVRGAMGRPEGDITQAEAQGVTRMDLSNKWQQYLPEGTLVQDLGGLEAFTNLASLDLSDQAVSDISALKGLTKLTSLSLAGNPVSDVSPLAGLTNLELLILSGSQAQDYETLANLVNLQVLLLDHSMITDLSPLSGLTNLQQLYLADTLTDDYSPLENIDPTLVKKDFIIPSTLAELGFTMDQIRHQALFTSEDVSILINHSKWGPPPGELDTDALEIAKVVGDVYKLGVGLYGDQNVYMVLLIKDGEELLNYVYDANSSQFAFGTGDQQSSEQALRAILNVDEGENVLLAPIGIFNDVIKKYFKITPEKLFSLPFELPTLKNMGFVPDQANAVYHYEQRGERDYNLEVHRPEWGTKDYDVRFNTPISELYRIVITYHAAERKYQVAIDDNDQGGAAFTYFIDTGEHVDDWCSYPDKTVDEYFIKAYNDPTIEDVYQYSVDLMVQYFNDKFGVTVEELFTLPTGE